jgi:mono/diheme cytochrome c family protein
MKIIFLLTLGLTLAFAACDYGGKNPGGHSPEEISRVTSEPPHTSAPRASAVAPEAGSGSYDGQQLYSQYCGICHGNGKSAPSLAGVFERRELPSGTPANDARVKDTIKMGRTMMPAFGGTLNDGQIDAIIAYLHTM